MLLVAACSSTGVESSVDSTLEAPISTGPPPSSTTEPLQPSATTPESSSTETLAADGTGSSPLAELVEPLGSALYDPADQVDDSPEPVSISIARLRVDAADVVDVGVESNGEMEIPSAPEDVGWYRFNPKPGQEGSAVLAGHINYNGTNGVFRHLSKLEVGDQVIIGYDDGSKTSFEVVERKQYNKEELPLDRIFAKSGDPVLTLITCGGSFNSSLRSYEDNFVVYAIPVEA
jgi:LPXTG-site transpeptidase (sortase) family protein